MADTTKIKTIIEPYVREWLSGQFPGHVFKEELITLSTGSYYKFDTVAEDGSIVGAVLCNRPKTRTGRENTGGVRKARNDIESLKLLPTDVKKLMIFTNVDFLKLIHRRAARFGIESIRMMECPLPPKLVLLLQQVLDEASREQRAAQ
jgi:hypothetical protein